MLHFFAVFVVFNELFLTFLWIWWLTQGGKEITNKETFLKESQENSYLAVVFMFEVMKTSSLQYASGPIIVAL